MPPSKGRFKKFRWTFGTRQPNGYQGVRYLGKFHLVHRIVCRAFHGLAPEGKPEVDHINRIKVDNQSCNLRYADRPLNCTNKDRVDCAFEKYGVRECEDPKAYNKAYYPDYYAKKKAQGLVKQKGPNGKWGWFPRVTPVKEVALCM